MAEVTVGIDIGTTAVKAVAADGDGKVVGRARFPHPLIAPAPERFEHDAAKAWRRGPRRALKELSAHHDVKAVSVVAMVPSLTAVDRRGVPQTPGLLYGDARGGGGDGEMAGFLEWTRAQQPDARGYWPAQAVANHALAGEAVLDTSAAASCTPVFSLERWGWDPDLGIDADRFPRVAGMGEAVGRIGETVLDAGGVDAVGEHLVAGADRDGDVMVILGTTLIVWCDAPEWSDVDGLVTIPHMGIPGRQYIGGPSNAGGLFINWANSWLGKPARTVAEVDPGRVPVWAPYPRGERSPLHDPARRASLHDVSLATDAAALRRAAFEASGFVTRRMIDLAGVDARRIVATGGGVRVAEWTQALADCTGLPVDAVAVPEGGALGAAFLARMAAGLASSMGEAGAWARTGGRIDPIPAWQREADGRYGRFLEVAG